MVCIFFLFFFFFLPSDPSHGFLLALLWGQSLCCWGSVNGPLIDALLCWFQLFVACKRGLDPNFSYWFLVVSFFYSVVGFGSTVDHKLAIAGKEEACCACARARVCMCVRVRMCGRACVCLGNRRAGAESWSLNILAVIQIDIVVDFVVVVNGEDS